jgi:uracil-DNA glycosylase
MSLDLDTRQRAMLQEMGVTVWQPEPVYIAESSVEVPEIAINKIAAQAVNTPAKAINAPPRVTSEKPPANLTANLPVKQPASLAVALQPMPAGLQDMDWASLQQIAQSCQACQLCTGRKGIVFGNHVNFEAANQQADWLIVGDPPTESDEAAGAPFTGEASVLLGAVRDFFTPSSGSDPSENDFGDGALRCAGVAGTNRQQPRAATGATSRCRSQLSRHSRRGDLFPRQFAAQPGGQSQGVGGFVFG